VNGFCIVDGGQDTAGDLKVKKEELLCRKDSYFSKRISGNTVV